MTPLRPPQRPADGAGRALPTPGAVASPVREPPLRSATERDTTAGGVVLACTLGYVVLGWVLNGLGAVLPPLRDEVGGGAAVYPLVPGLAMLATALVVARRQRVRPRPGTLTTVAGAMVGVAAMQLGMGATRWPLVSVLATVLMAIAAARLGRVLPGVLASIPGRDTNALLMRANGFSSLAGVAAPLFVGGSLGLGLGWLPGYAGPVMVAAVMVGALVRRRSPAPAVPGPVRASPPSSVAVTDARATANGRSWRLAMVVLTLSIVVEFCFTYFAATYLSDELELSNAVAAAGGAAWGLGMAGGRLASRRGGGRPLLVSLAVIGLGFGAMWLVAVPAIAVVGFGVAGVGAAPLYPNLLTVLIRRYPGPPDQAATYGLMASGLALVAAPGVMVGLRAVSDVRTAYLVVPVLLVVLVGLVALDRRR